tara:strand:- start:85 stop:903 length:819 start_codon:yes stop_codon:yes gene_type:complete
MKSKGTCAPTFSRGTKLVKSKRAQITIFAILAILLIVSIGLVFTLYQNNFGGFIKSKQQESTQIFEQCINEHVEIAVNKLLDHGGYLEEPALFKEYEYTNISYLCYTGLYYARCTQQLPNLISHLESEISDSIEPEIENCFQNLKKNLEDDNYDVTLGNLDSFNVQLIEGKVKTTVERTLTQEKSDDVKSEDSFEVNYKSSLYDFGIIASKISNQEASICNSDYLQIMRANTGFEINKIQTGDDNKIYQISNLENDETLQFAIRSCVLATPG